MKLCLIVNPNAGRGKGLEVAHHVDNVLTAAGIESRQIVSPAPGGTREIAEQLDTSAWDGVLAIGGDGTFFEVLNGLLGSGDPVGEARRSVPVGVVPVGTGNSFVKDLDVETADQALSPVLAGRTRRIDLGHFSSAAGSYYFANLLGAGFVSNVAARAHHYKGFGALSYVIGVVQEVIGLQATAITLEIDGRVIEQDAIFVEICNSRFTGGNMMMAPSACIDDGLLDVIVAGRMSRRKVLRLLPAIFSGRHVESVEVEVYQARSVRLNSERPMALTPDGEIFGATPIDVSVRPGAFEVFV